MNSTIALFKRLRLARILVVFLAGIVLLVSTACSRTPDVGASRMSDGSNSARMSGNRAGNQDANAPVMSEDFNAKRDKVFNNPNEQAKGSRPYQLKDIQKQHMEETYNPQPLSGGVNEYRDVETSLDTSNTDTNAEELINQAKRNLQRRASNPAEAVDNLKDTASIDKVGEKAGKVAGKIGRSLEETKEGAQKGVRNLRENIKSAPSYLSEQGQQTKQPNYFTGEPQQAADRL